MNRRKFFGAMGAASAALVLGRSIDIRRITFAPPGESPVIHWTTGHVSTERFMWMFSQMGGLPIHPSQIKQGWATYKLSGISMYLSDSPLENFEPITYWIPADQHE